MITMKTMITKKGVVIHPEEITKTWEKAILGSDINILGIHPVGGEHSHEKVKALADNGFPNEKDLIIKNLVSKGVSIEYELHAMSLLLPRELFASQPRYFRMNEKGERTPDYNCCASNKDALEIISDSASDLALKLPYSSDIYNFWLDDVFDASCKCGECSRLTSSDQALVIYNAVLRGLKRVNKNAKQSYLAYCGASDPPANIEPEEGIFLEYAPFKRDFFKPLISGDNALSVACARNAIAFFGVRGAKALDYWLDNSLYSGWKKPPLEFHINADIVMRDIEFYESLGFESVTSFACYLGEDYERLFGAPVLDGYIKKK